MIAANPGQVAAYRGGKEGLLGFFVGQVMKETGQGRPARRQRPRAGDGSRPDCTRRGGPTPGTLRGVHLRASRTRRPPGRPSPVPQLRALPPSRAPRPSRSSSRSPCRRAGPSAGSSGRRSRRAASSASNPHRRAARSLHLHGYDIEKTPRHRQDDRGSSSRPGCPGRFELELHHPDVLLAELTVQP